MLTKTRGRFQSKMPERARKSARANSAETVPTTLADFLEYEMKNDRKRRFSFGDYKTDPKCDLFPEDYCDKYGAALRNQFYM